MGSSADLRNNDDGTVDIAYYRLCSDGTSGWIFVDDPIPDAPLPTPADLADGARVQVERLVLDPAWHTPAETNRRQRLRADPDEPSGSTTTWTPVSARAEFGPVWAEATATPTAPSSSTPATARHRGALRVPTTGVDHAVQHRHLHRLRTPLPQLLRTRPQRRILHRHRLLEWTATWTGSDGSGGDLGTITTTAEPRQLLVAEMQAIVTGGG